MTQPAQVILQGDSEVAPGDKLVAVLPPCRFPGESPTSFTTKAQAWEWVRSGEARWDSKRRQAIRPTAVALRKIAEQRTEYPDSRQRGLSAMMPARVTELAAQRSSYHQGLVDGWYGRETPKVKPAASHEA